MRRSKASWRVRTTSIILAGTVGYLLGNWNADAVRSAQSSAATTAAQIVALRFPQNLGDAPTVQPAALAQHAVTSDIRNTEYALFEPEPMDPQQFIAREEVLPAEMANKAPAPPVQPAPVAAVPISLPKQVIAAQPRPPIPHQANRPRYLLDGAQIAGIKRRLHLTSEQERMWPAVAVALRNIGTERERDLRARGSTAAIDPNSSEVEDLKSAAIPLLMSFSDEQKDEVRNLVHVMGLDQLASEF